MKKSFKMRTSMVFLVVMIALVMSGCTNSEDGKDSNVLGFAKKPKEETINLQILAAGDIMAHSTQIEAQYDATLGTYDFNNNFSYVKKYIEEADLALCNVETVFAEGAYGGYPLFNAPESLATAIKNAGFDVAFTSNNHILDRGQSGFDRTIDVLRDNGLSVAGSQKAGESRYLMTQAKGVKIGIVSYTYETPSVGENRTINGIKIPEGVKGRLNSFQPANLEADMPEILADINGAKKDGADIIICYFHWGEEYQTEPRDYQKKMAKAVADAGVDVVFASHPHVLQSAEVIQSEVSGKAVPIFYSMGNYISNQRRETLDNKKLTENGLMARVNFQVTMTDDKASKVELEKADGIFTWVNRYKEGKTVYEIIPLDAGLEGYESLAVSGNLSKASGAIVDSANIIGPQYYNSDQRTLVIYDNIQAKE